MVSLYILLSHPKRYVLEKISLFYSIFNFTKFNVLSIQEFDKLSKQTDDTNTFTWGKESHNNN